MTVSPIRRTSTSSDASGRTCAREGCDNPARVRWCSDRCKWAAKPKSTSDSVAFCRAMISALGDKIAAGDPEDLAPLAELRDLIDDTMADVIVSMKANSACSWADIGEALGITRQTAHERFGRRRAG